MKRVLLVVEDDESIRGVVQQALEMEGYEIHCAVNGQAALDSLYSHPLPVLIITDLSMPVMGGRQFIEQVRMNPIFRDIPIIVISADKDVADLKRKVSHVISKPFSLEQLSLAVRESIGEND